MQKILIVDDDSPLRSLIATALRANGFEIVEAGGGAEGLARAREHLPDLVISDVNMEGLDGYGFLEQLRSKTDTSAIPVILMTGGSENTMRKSMNLGADDYLSKPFNPATLVAAVKTRLNRKEEIDQRLRDVQERLLAIVSSTSDLVAILDRATERTVYLNPAGRLMLGIAPDEDVAQFNLKQCFSSGKEDEFEKYVRQAEAHGRWTGECRLAGRNNKSLAVELQLLAHRSEKGDVTWLSVIGSDLTATMQLRQAQKMEAVGRLAAGIAHEINTPTQYVGDNTKFLKNSFQDIAKAIEAHRAVFNAAKSGAPVSMELLSRVEEVESEIDLGYLLEQIPSAVNETLEGVGRVAKIVRAMKEFSHPGSNEKAPTNLNKAIETTVAVARNEWRYVADVALELDPQLPLVPCLAGEFNQAILNLVVNAAHAIGDLVKKQPGTKGTITIRTRRDGDDVEVRVADTGAGIPESVRPRIFEPFFTTKPVGEGTGQGLAFVYSTVTKKHSGHISFETELGKGTAFVLRFPITARASGK